MECGVNIIRIYAPHMKEETSIMRKMTATGKTIWHIIGPCPWTDAAPGFRGKRFDIATKIPHITIAQNKNKTKAETTFSVLPTPYQNSSLKPFLNHRVNSTFIDENLTSNSQTVNPNSFAVTQNPSSSNMQWTQARIISASQTRGRRRKPTVTSFLRGMEELLFVTNPI